MFVPVEAGLLSQTTKHIDHKPEKHADKGHAICPNQKQQNIHS